MDDTLIKKQSTSINLSPPLPTAGILIANMYKRQKYAMLGLVQKKIARHSPRHYGYYNHYRPITPGRPLHDLPHYTHWHHYDESHHNHGVPPHFNGMPHHPGYHTGPYYGHKPYHRPHYHHGYPYHGSHIHHGDPQFHGNPSYEPGYNYNKFTTLPIEPTTSAYEGDHSTGTSINNNNNEETEQNYNDSESLDETYIDIFGTPNNTETTEFPEIDIRFKDQSKPDSVTPTNIIENNKSQEKYTMTSFQAIPVTPQE